MNTYDAVRYFLHVLTKRQIVRHVNPVGFLAIACEEEQLDRAIAQLASDLNKLDKEVPILGNLKSFFITALANTIGNDEQIYAVCSYPIVQLSMSKYRLLGSNERDKLIHDKGILSWVREGGITYLDGKSPYSDLLITPTPICIKTPEVTFIDDRKPIDQWPLKAKEVPEGNK